MKNSFFLAGSLALSLLAASCANNSTPDSKEMAENANEAKIDSAKATDTSSSTTSSMSDMKPDAEFAVAAADGGMMEVQLGKLAQEKGVSKQVKDLGAMMVKDHGAANEELKTAAAAKNITLPASLSDKCQKQVQDLSAKTGADFDKAYADLMVSDHKDDIDAFKKEAEKGNDAELRAWAQGKLATLEHHLQMAETTKKAVDKK
jgi:putative membrane protein